MSRWRNRALVCGGFALLCGAARLPAQDEAPGVIRQRVLRRLESATVQRSACGRFVVLGRDRLENARLLRWAQSFVDRFELATGIRMPADRWRLRILIEEGAADDAPSVSADARDREGWTVQQLKVRHCARLEMKDAAERLTGLLLQASVLHGAGRKTPLSRPLRPEEALPVPCWLSRGLAQSFYPDLRAIDSDRCVARWEKGRLPPLAGFLRVAGPHRRAADSPMSGLVVGWMLSQRDWRQDLQRYLGRLGERRACPPEWLVTLFAGCRSIMDLESAWDGWILAQRRIVQQPGVATPRVIRELERERLLYAGDSGIPFKGRMGYSMALDELIGSRGAPRLQDVARLKGAALRRLGVGRGRDVAEVVGHYCAFLAAVAGGDETKERLRERLADAERGLRGLKEKAGAETKSGEGEEP